MKRQRTATVTHFCILFSIVAWLLCQPFVASALATRERSLMLERSTRWTHYSLSDHEIHQLDSRATGEPTASWSKALKALFFDFSPALRAWSFFSLLFGLLVLFEVRGISAAVWILPILVALYPLFPGTSTSSIRFDAHLYPSEEQIIQEVLQETPAIGISEQRRQLMKGWEHYLILHYLQERVSSEPNRYIEQVSRGKELFEMARVRALAEAKQNDPLSSPVRLPRPIWFLLLIWNLFFALLLTWPPRQESRLSVG